METKTRRGHQNLAHLRTEAYPLYRQCLYPPGRGGDRDNLSVDKLDEAIGEAKEKLGYGD